MLQFKMKTGDGRIINHVELQHEENQKENGSNTADDCQMVMGDDNIICPDNSSDITNINNAHGRCHRLNEKDFEKYIDDIRELTLKLLTDAE